MELPNRILFICHDGDLYGSQQSLNLLIRNLTGSSYVETPYQCFVSIARPGPLEALLNTLPNTVVLHHKRLQWVKHDPRTWLQRFGDILTLAVSVLPRTLYLFNTIRRHKINVVHTNSTVSLEGALAAAIAGVPHIWHIRELFMEPSPKFHLTLGRKISRWIIDRFSEDVLCISQAVRNQFGPYLDEDPDKFQVLYNAMELSGNPGLPSLSDSQHQFMRSLSLRALHLPDDLKVFRIGYIGRLSAGKGFHELLEAAILLKPRLDAKNMAFEVLVAGNFVDAAYEARIRERIQEAGLESVIRFLGYQGDLVPLHEVLDVLVVPSRNEPFGRVVIEAMAAGVPVVGSDSGGIPEIIDSDSVGLLYPPGDAAALAETLEGLTSAFWKLETIRQNARRMVCERFNIETQIRTLDECYQSVIARQQLC